MKTSSLVKKYYTKQKKRLLSLLKKNPGDYQEEDFHTIRVAIKKVKAVFSMLGKIDPAFKRKKYFQPFSMIFEQAGAVRDRMVLHQMLEAYHSNPSSHHFRTELQSHIDKEKHEFFKLLNKDLLKKFHRKDAKVKKALDRIDYSSTLKYVDKKAKAIRSILQTSQLLPIVVHDLRKRIKDLYYLQKMLEPKVQEVFPTDKFQDELGQWHDGRLLALSMAEFKNNGILSGKEKQAVSELQSKIAEKNDRQLRAFIRHKTSLLRLFDR